MKFQHIGVIITVKSALLFGGPQDWFLPSRLGPQIDAPELKAAQLAHANRRCDGLPVSTELCAHAPGDFRSDGFQHAGG